MIKERIIQVIEYKGVAKENFYSKIGMTSANFRGDAKKRPINSNTIENILSEFPDLNTNWLLTGRGEMFESYNNSSAEIVLNDTSNSYEVQPKVITVDSHNKDNIVLVPQKLKAGYLSGYNDPSFIKKLPSYRMPGLNNGVFRMFEIEGNSMFPTLPNKSFVVGQFVENWITGIKDNQIYAIISNDIEDGLVKRCTNRIKKYDNLICKSDNRRNFPTQNIEPSSIKEVWEIKLHLNFQLPDPADIYDRMDDLEAELQQVKRLLPK